MGRMVGWPGPLNSRLPVARAPLLNKRPDTARDAEIKFFIEQLRVVHGLIDQEQTDRGEDIGRHPHPADRRKDGLFHEFFTEVIQQEKDDEEDHGKYQWQSDPALADDRPQRRADQEHDHDGHGQRDFFMPCDLMLAKIVVLILIQQHGLVQTDLGAVEGGHRLIDDR